MKLVPNREAQNIKLHRTKFSRSGDLASLVIIP